MEYIIQENLATFLFLSVLTPFVILGHSVWVWLNQREQTSRGTVNNIFIFGILSIAIIFSIISLPCISRSPVIKVDFMYVAARFRGIVSGDNKIPAELPPARTNERGFVYHYITDTTFDREKRVDNGIFLWTWYRDVLYVAGANSGNLEFRKSDYNNGLLPKLYNWHSDKMFKYPADYEKLYDALWGNDEKISLELIAKMSLSELDLPDMNGITLLMRAVNWERLAAVRAMLTRGVNVRTQNIFYDTALEIARRGNNRELIDLLKNNLPEGE